MQWEDNINMPGGNFVLLQAGKLSYMTVNGLSEGVVIFGRILILKSRHAAAPVRYQLA